MPDTRASTPLHFQSATVLASMIRDNEVTSLHLTNMFIKRIEELDGPINAVVVRCFDAARVRAADLDADLARGVNRGPLHGVPCTVKENNNVKVRRAFSQSVCCDAGRRSACVHFMWSTSNH